MSAVGRGKAEADRGAGRIAPGEHLRAELARLGLDQVAVSKATGVSRQLVNNIVNGRQAISRAMAGKLGRLTGYGSDYWLAESFAKSHSGKKVEARPAQAAALSLLVDHQIARAVKDGVIGIQPFVPKNLKAASITLTLAGIIGVGGGARVNMARAGNFSLEPGHAVSATTRERIELPRDYFGRASAVAALSGHGIIASCGFQIGPGYRGHLKLSLFNAGPEAFRLRANDGIVQLEIFRLGAVPDAAGP